MLIVCTKDADCVNWAVNTNSGSAAWGAVNQIPVLASQLQASQQLGNYLAALNANEPLCLYAHGNDHEIGDSGGGVGDWGWSIKQLAVILGNNAPGKYQGPILIQACAKNVVNFSAGLAVELGKLDKLVGVWVYGYNRPVDVTKSFPPPSKLEKQVDLQGTQVSAS